MPKPIQPPETDLWLPRPGPEDVWDPGLLHTYYFGLSVPDERIGGYLYLLHRPTLGISQGGVVLWQGDEADDLLDVAYVDYETAMPWPRIDGGVIESANGLRIAFEEPGERCRITYTSADGETTVDVVQTGITPLLGRGHCVPGEELIRSAGSAAGGSEQMMHVTGELRLRGRSYAVDCRNLRDRSWNQVRTESRRRLAALPASPPIAATVLSFADGLVGNIISIEDPGENPGWEGLYDVDPTKPTHLYGWLFDHGEEREIARVSRVVSERHPLFHTAHEQELVVDLVDGEQLRFRGETTSMCRMPAWPNAAFRVGTARWTDEAGRNCDNTYTEMWLDDVYQRALTARPGSSRYNMS